MSGGTKLWLDGQVFLNNDTSLLRPAGGASRSAPTMTATTNHLPTTTIVSSSKKEKQKKEQKEPKKRLECPQCHKTFSKHNHLTRHQQIHSGDRPFSCSLCEKRYLRISDLKVHLRSHSGERPYVCDKCQKRYITSSHLRMHQRTHADDVRSFECQVCLRTFSSSNGLTQHSYVHQKDAASSTGSHTKCSSTEAIANAADAVALPPCDTRAGEGATTFSATALSIDGAAHAAPSASTTTTAGTAAAPTSVSSATPSAAPIICWVQEGSTHAAARSTKVSLAAACTRSVSSCTTTATAASAVSSSTAEAILSNRNTVPVAPTCAPPRAVAAAGGEGLDRSSNAFRAAGLQHLAQAAALLHPTTSNEAGK